MIEPYSFEFEGITIVYHRATVRSEMETAQIRDKLIDGLGYDGTMPMNEWVNVNAYAETMGRCKADAMWHCHSNMTAAEIKAAYDLFCEQSGDLYRLFQKAYTATLPPKKTEFPE